MTTRKELSSITIGDVEMADYPDFSMAFVEEAYSDILGRWLNEFELEELTESGFAQEYIQYNLDLYR